MSKLSIFAAGIAGFITGLLQLILWVAGAAIHVWTILIAFAVKGFIGAVITLIFPVLAQIYWGFYSIGSSGSIINTYTIALFAYLAIIAIIAVIMMFIAKDEQ